MWGLSFMAGRLYCAKLYTFALVFPFPGFCYRAINNNLDRETFRVGTYSDRPNILDCLSFSTITRTTKFEIVFHLISHKLHP